MFAYCNNNPMNACDPSGCTCIFERNFGGGCVGYTDAGTARPCSEWSSPYAKRLRTQVSSLLEEYNYSSGQWQEFDPSTQEAICRDLYQKVGDIFGINGYDLKFQDLYSCEEWAKTCQGNPNTKINTDRVIINTRCLSDVKILKVIVHEAYHVYQYQVVDGIIHSNERTSIIRLWAKEKGTPVHLNMELSANWIAGLLNEKDNGIR